jgi:hypothetical protein
MTKRHALPREATDADRKVRPRRSSVPAGPHALAGGRLPQTGSRLTDNAASVTGAAGPALRMARLSFALTETLAKMPSSTSLKIGSTSGRPENRTSAFSLPPSIFAIRREAIENRLGRLGQNKRLTLLVPRQGRSKGK